MVDLYPALSRIYSLRYIIQIIFRGNQLDSSTIVQVLWKRLNAETSQRGNASKTGFEEFPFFFGKSLKTGKC